jgi:MFS family permease
MRVKNFVLIWLGTFCFWASVSALATVYPLYMDSYGFDAATIGLVTGSAALGGLLGRPFLGWAVDRWGTRVFLVMGGAIWFLTAPLAAMITSSTALFILRLVQGVGGGMYTAAALGYVGYVTPWLRRGRMISWWDTSGSAANLVVPLLAAALFVSLGFLPAFWFGGFMGLLSAILALFLPNVVPGENAPGSALKFRFFTRSALGPGVFSAAAGAAAGGVIVLSPLLGDELGLANVGIFAMMFSLGSLVVRPIAGPVSDQRGRAWVIFPGFVLITISVVLLGLWVSPWTGYLVPFVFGVGMGSVVPGLMALSVDGSRAEERGTAGNTYFTFWEIGIFLGSYLQGWLLDTAGMHGYLVTAGFLLLTLVAFAFYSPRIVKPVEEPTPA